MLTVMLILAVSVPVAGVIDNIPYVATMAPIVCCSTLPQSFAARAFVQRAWCSLIVGSADPMTASCGP